MSYLNSTLLLLNHLNDLFYNIMSGMVAYCGADGAAVRFQVRVAFCWRYTCNYQHLFWRGIRTLYDQNSQDFNPCIPLF